MSAALAADPALPAAAHPGTASLWLGTLDGIDLGDLDTVFAAVFAALPAETTVRPSENYQYLRFESGGREMWGNLRLSVLDRDEGRLHFAYYEFQPGGVRVADALPAQHRALGPEDGLALERVAEDHYVATYAGKSVAFHLPTLDPAGPRLWSPAPDETVVFRTQDESGLRFFLVFDGARERFLWVLDEEGPAADTLVAVPGAPGVTVGERTGFAFLQDPAQERQLLVGVHAPNVRENNYYDGPFDQLADNVITDASPLRGFIERAHPATAGRIDAYGHYLDKEGARVAITPYAYWERATELPAIAACADALGTPSLPRCLVESQRASLPESPVEACIWPPIHDSLTTTYGHSIDESLLSVACDDGVSSAACVAEHDEFLSLDHSWRLSMIPLTGPWHDPETSQGGCFPPDEPIGAVCATGPLAGIAHDGKTSRTCTDLHYNAFSIAWGAAVCPSEVSPVLAGVVHDGATSRGCTDPPIHFGRDSHQSAGICPGLHDPEFSRFRETFHLMLGSLLTGIVHNERTSGGCTDPHRAVPSHDYDLSVALGIGPAAIVHEEGTSRGCTDHGMPWIRVCASPPTDVPGSGGGRVYAVPGHGDVGVGYGSYGHSEPYASNGGPVHRLYVLGHLTTAVVCHDCGGTGEATEPITGGEDQGVNVGGVVLPTPARDGVVYVSSSDDMYGQGSSYIIVCQDLDGDNWCGGAGEPITEGCGDQALGVVAGAKLVVAVPQSGVDADLNVCFASFGTVHATFN